MNLRKTLILNPTFAILAALAMLLCCSNSIAAESFTAGKDYLLVHSNNPLKSASKTTVTEFFSYGCGGCAALDPYLTRWAAKQPKQIVFQRIPVAFHEQWIPLAKAYYIAKGLGIESKATPMLFKEIHLNGHALTSREDLAPLFNELGVTTQQFNSAYSHSPTIDFQLKQGDELAEKIGLKMVPSVVVNGHYLLTLETARSFDRFIEILNFLTQKVEQEKS